MQLFQDRFAGHGAGVTGWPPEAANSDTYMYTNGDVPACSHTLLCVFAPLKHGHAAVAFLGHADPLRPLL